MEGGDSDPIALVQTIESLRAQIATASRVLYSASWADSSCACDECVDVIPDDDVGAAATMVDPWAAALGAAPEPAAVADSAVGTAGCERDFTGEQSAKVQQLKEELEDALKRAAEIGAYVPPAAAPPLLPKPPAPHGSAGAAAAAAAAPTAAAGGSASFAPPGGGMMGGMMLGGGGGRRRGDLMLD